MGYVMLDFHFDFNLFNSNYYLYERLLVLLFSLVPSILLVVFVIYTDRKSKEPIKNILLCVFSGILTIALAKNFETLVMPYISNSIILTYVWAMIEELSKMSIFFLFIFDNKYFDDIYDGIVYMALIALSFAGLENVMYAFSESTVTESISLALMRDFTTIPLHVICGIVIGAFLSKASFSKDRVHKFKNIAYACLLPTFIHGTFNNLMSLLSVIDVDKGNSIQILLFLILPLVLIMVALALIAFIFINKTVNLNNIFINDESYDDKDNYLMTHSEFMSSNIVVSRERRYNKLKGIKQSNDASEENYVEELNLNETNNDKDIDADIKMIDDNIDEYDYDLIINDDIDNAIDDAIKEAFTNDASLQNINDYSGLNKKRKFQESKKRRLYYKNNNK